MTTTQLERRMALLESKLARLQNRVDRLPIKPATTSEWLDEIWGSFAGDPLFDEAMRYGRQWRERQNRKPRSNTKGSATKHRRK